MFPALQLATKVCTYRSELSYNYNNKVVISDTACVKILFTYPNNTLWNEFGIFIYTTISPFSSAKYVYTT